MHKGATFCILYILMVQTILNPDIWPKWFILFCFDFKEILHKPFDYNVSWLCMYSLRMCMKIHLALLEIQQQPVGSERFNAKYNVKEKI